MTQQFRIGNLIKFNGTVGLILAKASVGYSKFVGFANKQGWLVLFGEQKCVVFEDEFEFIG